MSSVDRLIFGDYETLYLAFMQKTRQFKRVELFKIHGRSERGHGDGWCNNRWRQKIG